MCRSEYVVSLTLIIHTLEQPRMELHQAPGLAETFVLLEQRNEVLE
ncbi:MAG: hypothetical protein IPJ38_00205 [Dechloromonas sp.]|uniref:Uncharacterized protein n=1 Tax=Candidatus Dechloromonas phosphorivorans TaxID=2899244 RepID=A0A935JU24_9RHOO|nr:hypothetical protein [Candidatus Dechloromonas phosphorivorans]